jgi:hypothetical protein
LILLSGGELVQLRGFVERLVDAAQGTDDDLKRRAFAPEILRALGIGPDLRVLELSVYFLEALALRVIVKGTPGERRCAP